LLIFFQVVADNIPLNHLTTATLSLYYMARDALVDEFYSRTWMTTTFGCFSHVSIYTIYQIPVQRTFLEKEYE